MELQIDPSFLPAFDRLRVAFRKKAGQVREALATASRTGRGLPQTDKLTLAWKQHNRAVFWVRVDRAIRLMYEQEGDTQTVLYVGKHEEAEEFLRKLPRRTSPDAAISVSDWLQRTAPPAAAVRIDGGEADRKPMSGHGAQRQLVQALESLFEDCLLSAGPAVVEEFASPLLLELEKRLAALSDQLSEAARLERMEREHFASRLEEVTERAVRLERSLPAVKVDVASVAAEVEALKKLVMETAAETRRQGQAAFEECRRVIADDLAELRETRRRDAEKRREQVQAIEGRIADLDRAGAELRAGLRARLSNLLQDCRRQREADLERLGRAQAEDRERTTAQLAEAERRITAGQALLDEQRESLAALAQRVDVLEKRLAECEARGGWWRRLVPFRR